LWLKGMHQIGKFDSIMYEKHRNIVGYQIIVPFLGIKFSGKTTTVPNGISRSPKTHYLGETDKHGRLRVRVGEKFSFGKSFHRVIVRLEISMRSRASRMDNTFRNVLMIKVSHLLPEMKIFHQGRPS